MATTLVAFRSPPPPPPSLNADLSRGRSRLNLAGAGARRIVRPMLARRRGGGQGEEAAVVRTLLIDNYDSYTYNVYQELSVVNGVPPVVIQNDEWTWDYICYCLYEEMAFDNIVISPGPGSPACPPDIGICLQILLECSDIPILGICLGHQALGVVHGARIVHAPEPVHGRLSEIEHNGCSLFIDIPSGRKSGFKVVRYHSLVIDARSLPKQLIPISWTSSLHIQSFLETQKSETILGAFGNQTNQFELVDHSVDEIKVAALSRPSKFNDLEDINILMGVMHSSRPHYGVQFHPESIATSHGRQIFKNFKKITIDCGLRSSRLLHERKVPYACQSYKEFPKRRQFDSRVIRQSLTISEIPMVPIKNVDGKYLTLQWKKIGGLVSQVGGAASIFCELFEDMNAKDTFWLDSSSTDQGRARFSFMGGRGGSLWKQITFQLSDESKLSGEPGGHLSIQDSQGSVKTAFVKKGFLDFLNKELQSFHYDKQDYEELPFDFYGGFIGFIGYNLKVECGASSNCHNSTTPDACFFFADNLVVIDHSNGDVYILSIQEISHPSTENLVQERLKDKSWLVVTEERLNRLKALANKKLNFQKLHTRSSTPSQFVIDKSRPQYIRDVEKCMQFIRDGESYELCLTTQMRKRVGNINALKLYLDLREQNPAPYAAWLNFAQENLTICCSSPERFLRLDRNETLEAKPIKGTIARGRTPEEDEHLRLQLQYSEKDQAENLMIVDLLRNDLGRVCEPGSVSVPRLMEVESYASVHTMVSTIQGKKKPNVSPVDCVRAAFPGGSMTGAPKLRSMELLDSLESSSRGIYSGSIGFFSYNQTFDLNIVIRTVVIHNGEASVGAGGAIVALSNPEDEYAEMLLKAKVPTKVVEDCTTELGQCGTSLNFAA